MSIAFRRLPTWLCVATVCAAVVMSAGCSQMARRPETIVNVTSADLSRQHPACFEEKGQAAPKAFLVRGDAEWRQVWGQGEDPPVVNFEKSMVLCAYTSLSSEGPGTIEVWVQKFRETDELVEVQVREVINGSFPLSAAFSRAYHFVKLPRSDKPVKVQWQFLWGTRDETRQIEAKDWAPQAASLGGQPGASGQGYLGGPSLSR